MAFAESRRHLRVAVLAGGESAEREVSLRSGTSVVESLAAAGHDVARVDPAHLPLGEANLPSFDACFIALHGGAGEDGSVQAELEMLGVPYTGSGAETCRLAMSKAASKRRFMAHGVPTPRYATIDEHDSLADVSRRAGRVGYPLVVKPDAQGSSIGVTVVYDSVELPQALAEAKTFGGPCLLERCVQGREFTVALLDDRPLPMIEIVTPEQVFSYDAKYHSSLTEYRFDFALSADARAQIERAAVAAGRALSTAGLSRVDLMLSQEGEVGVLEVNTVPGLTVRSLAPLAAARAGIDMPELCDLLVRRSLAPAGVL
ncbi:MAG: D-alanine--D-alanine ligase [Planctomycetota bacterium]|nr:MAG: D-alanine--D-alanine ligase [Planctomycetota bacterium]